MAIWDPQHETIDREQLEELQLPRVRDMLARVYERVPFYRDKLGAAGFEPGDLTSLEGVADLPFTEKTDFRDNYPYGLFAVPMSEVVEIHSSSGTTGKAVVGGYTKADLDTWTELVCRLAVAAGAHDGDVAQIAFGYGMFTGGFGLHYGLQRAGVAVLPISAGNTARQIQYMKDFGTTILIATPSYALYIGEVLQRREVPLEQLRLRLGMFGAEHCSEEMRAQIESRLPIRATDNYGLTELTGPGVAGECECRSGMHISEDHFLAECLDPATGKPVADGEVGELVVTAFTRECSPVLRYRTRDLTSLTRERCACGRTTARMGKVVGAPTTCSSSAASTSSRRRSRACCSRSRASSRSTRSCSGARTGWTRSRCTSRSRTRSSTAGWTTCARSSAESPKNFARRSSSAPRSSWSSRASSSAARARPGASSTTGRTDPGAPWGGRGGRRRRRPAYVKAGGASPRFAPPAKVKVDLEVPLSESSGLLAMTSGDAARGA